jgi:adenosylmethionine-8-amino-7-oxononanoate aminotransferase
MGAHKYPQGHVFYRPLNGDHLLIARGEGIYLFDSEGNRYLDGAGGAVVANLGHGVTEIVEAIAAQAARVAYVHPTVFTSQVLEDYAGRLAEITPLPDPRFYFLSSGSEAVETAIKLARHIQIRRGEPNRYLTIGRWGSYHGTTIGALSVTGKAKMRRPYQPMLIEAPHIPPPYCYRCPYGLTYPECGLRCADALEEAILQAGPENVAGFIAEPVSGATLAAVVPPDGYWPRIREICDRYGVLLIADEVMTGMGRTGGWFAIERWGVVPDILTMGKGTAGGYFPLSITAVRGEWAEALAAGGDFNHGGTFSHHAVGAAAGLATLDYLIKHKLVPAVARKGKIMERKLRAALGDHPQVGDIRGTGLLWGLEFVADRETKAPYPASAHISEKITAAALANGLLVYPGSGNVDGSAGDILTLGPPFTITEPQIDELAGLLAETLERFPFP